MEIPSRISNRIQIRRQFGIGKYVLDFYCPKLRLGIEIDGITHEGETKMREDKTRQRYIEGLEIFIKRYPSQNIFYHLQDVLSDIRETCKYLASTKDNHPVKFKKLNSPPS